MATTLWEAAPAVLSFGRPGPPMPAVMRERFHRLGSNGLGLAKLVAYNPQKGWAARGAYVITAKLPERDGQFEYRIRSPNEQHERMARESELQPMSENEAQPAGSKRKR